MHAIERAEAKKEKGEKKKWFDEMCQTLQNLCLNMCSFFDNNNDFEECKMAWKENDQKGNEDGSRNRRIRAKVTKAKLFGRQCVAVALLLLFFCLGEHENIYVRIYWDGQSKMHSIDFEYVFRFCQRCWRWFFRFALPSFSTLLRWWCDAYQMLWRFFFFMHDELVACWHSFVRAQHRRKCTVITLVPMGNTHTRTHVHLHCISAIAIARPDIEIEEKKIAHWIVHIVFGLSVRAHFDATTKFNTISCFRK